MSNLVVRGMATSGTVVTAGLGPADGGIFARALSGALQLAGTVITTFIPASAGKTNSYSRRFFGTSFGPKGRGHE